MGEKNWVFEWEIRLSHWVPQVLRIDRWRG